LNRGEAMRIFLVTVIFLSAFTSKSDIGFLLHESIGNPWFMKKKVDTGFLTQGGHGAILVSDLCAETPTRLRKCQPGEEAGVVISRYDGLSKEDYDWIAVPVSWYFYGVSSREQKPLFATGQVYEKLAEKFYEQFLSLSIKSQRGGELPPGRWRDTVAASFRRDIYSFNIRYDNNSEANILKPLNESLNHSSFEFFVRNCSDFAGDFFARYFPAFNRTNAADTGLTSPKGVARSVAQLGQSLPPSHYNVSFYEQVPGDYDRSRNNLFPMENAIRNPKYAVLLIHYQPVLQVAFALTWGLVFKFNPRQEYLNHFSNQVSTLSYAYAQLSESYDRVSEEVRRAEVSGSNLAQLKALQSRREILEKISLVQKSIQTFREVSFGTDAGWKEFQQTVELLKTQSELPSHLFEKLEKNGKFQWEGNSLVLIWNSPKGIKHAVVAGENVGTGDQELVRWIRIARLSYFARSKKENRPQLTQLRQEFEEVLGL